MSNQEFDPNEVGNLAIDGELNKILNKQYGLIVRGKLENLKEERLLAATARRIGVSPNRLTEIKDADRPLTAYYLARMILGDMMTLDELLQGRKLNDLPKKERIFFQRLQLDDEEICLIAAAKDQGTDTKSLLRSIVSKPEICE